MDTVWHEVILDTKAHSAIQKSLGFEQHHRPEGASDGEKDARLIGLTTMETLYTKFFEGMRLLVLVMSHQIIPHAVNFNNELACESSVDRIGGSARLISSTGYHLHPQNSQ